MDLSLDDQQLMFRDTARLFVDEAVVPFSREWDRRESVDRKIVGRLGEVGFLGLTIPEEYGGTSCDYLSYCLVMEELGRGDSSVRGIVSVSLGLAAKQILAFGTEHQKERWLPDLCAGRAVGCFGLTEPDTGSDAGNLSTRALRDGDDWILNGAKIFITNGSWADVALIFARTGEPGPRGITCFAIDTDTPGFAATRIEGKLGLRGQDTAELALHDVRVPDSDRLGEVGAGFKIAMHALHKGRMSVAASCVGLARACLEASTAYAVGRPQFGRPIAGFQLVQELLADMAVQTDAARLMVWRVADLVDRGLPFETESSMAKYYASEVAVRASNAAVEVHGGYGYIDEYPVSKYLRDARVMTLYEGTSQVQKLLIGRKLTGISAFA
ncbi:MAG: acyl-CoA dehydrogenase family protein [Acidimicrobiia bacterium]